MRKSKFSEHLMIAILKAVEAGCHAKTLPELATIPLGARL